jgi:hypothetical protein
VGLKTNQASNPWTRAGFNANNLFFDPLAGPGNNYTIADQSIDANTPNLACTSVMTVYGTVQQ